MKSCTDLEQSKKLSEILPLTSADMHYERAYFEGKQSDWFIALGRPIKSDDIIPCWSLAALLSILPKSLIYTPNPALKGYCCKNIMHDLETYGENPVDACYEMLIKLHELKMLYYDYRRKS